MDQSELRNKIINCTGFERGDLAINHNVIRFHNATFSKSEWLDFSFDEVTIQISNCHLQTIKIYNINVGSIEFQNCIISNEIHLEINDISNIVLFDRCRLNQFEKWSIKGIADRARVDMRWINADTQSQSPILNVSNCELSLQSNQLLFFKDVQFLNSTVNTDFFSDYTQNIYLHKTILINQAVISIVGLQNFSAEYCDLKKGLIFTERSQNYSRAFPNISFLGCELGSHVHFDGHGMNVRIHQSTYKKCRMLVDVSESFALNMEGARNDSLSGLDIQIENFGSGGARLSNISIDTLLIGSKNFAEQKVMKGGLSFERVDFDTISIEKCDFDEEIHFSHCKIGGFHSHLSNFKRMTWFRNCEFVHAPRFSSCELYQDTKFTETEFKDLSGAADEAYRSLKQHMIKYGNIEDEIKFASMELECNWSAATWKKSFVFKLAGLFYFLANRFGRNIWQPFAWLIGITLIATIYYCFGHGVIIDSRGVEGTWTMQLQSMPYGFQALFYSAVNSLGPLKLHPAFQRLQSADLWTLVVSFCHALLSSYLWYLIIIWLKKRFRSN